MKKFNVGHLLLLNVVIAALSGCGASVPFIQLGTKALYKTQQDLVGSSQKEIISCLGVPNNQIKLSDEEFWEYEFTDKETELVCKTNFRFVDSIVVEVSFSDLDNGHDLRKYNHRVCFPLVDQCSKSK